jgi:hypothetical protein
MNTAKWSAYSDDGAVCVQVTAAVSGECVAVTMTPEEALSFAENVVSAAEWAKREGRD